MKLRGPLPMSDLMTESLRGRLLPLPAASAGAGEVVEVVNGRLPVLRMLPEYDELARRCRLPLTARAVWVRARLESDTSAAPWAVVLRAADGGMRAAIVLLDQSAQPRHGMFAAEAGHTVLASGGEGYRAGVAAVDPRAAGSLGSALAAELARRPGRRELELGPLADDEVSGWLAAALGAQVVRCDPVPWVRSTEGPEGTAYLSHGLRKTLRKARNRMATDGLTHEIRFSSDPSALSGLLPAMEEAYRDRDNEHGLACLLDTPEGLALWRGRVLGLMDAGCLEVATLTVDGQLAAYVLGVLDGDRYGILEGRFVTALARYAPGRLLEAAVLERVVQDDRFIGLDWMTGVAPETLLATNDVDNAVLIRRPATGPHLSCPASLLS